MPGTGQADGCIGLLRKRAAERSQQRRLEAQRRRMQGPGPSPAPEQPAPREHAPLAGDGREQGVCVVCIDSRADTVFLCGHMCVCEQCSMGLLSCPICRRRSKPIRVFET